MTQQSHELFNLAQQLIPGGVNSPVRAFRGVGGEPIFFERGQGAYLYDVDHNVYIDYVGSWGPLILGHAHPKVISAVNAAAEKGLTFGAPTKAEIQLAEKVCQIMPAIEMVRMVNSGTEATMSAIRLARGFTSRNKIIKFEGCYHGHADALLVKAGSGGLTLGIPNSKGVPTSFVEHTLTARFNDLNSVKQLFETYGDDIAAVILEPVVGNANCIPPLADFLPGLRALCDQYQSILIFDEVMTGFRVAHGGAQEYYRIKPDLVTLGKIIGGGMPVGAFGGRKEIMQHLAPLGGVYQAGTLSGNPIAMAAGLATLNELDNISLYHHLEKSTKHLMLGLKECANNAGIPLTVNWVGSMFGIFFTEKESVNYYEDAIACDVDRFKKFFHGMLKEGVYLAPSAFEAGFLSIAHNEIVIEKTLAAATKVFKTL